MNTPLTARLVLAALVGAFAAGANAQTATSEVEADAHTATTLEAEPVEKINAADEPATHPFCLRSTGSLLRPRRHRDARGPACVNASGRVYTQEDLRRSGAIDIADALRRLDSGIR